MYIFRFVVETWMPPRSTTVWVRAEERDIAEEIFSEDWNIRLEEQFTLQEKQTLEEVLGFDPNKVSTP